MEKLNSLIQNEADLETLMNRARKTDAVALDTEFVWERTYYPQLGLIQIALSDEECYLIDPIAIKIYSHSGNFYPTVESLKFFMTHHRTWQFSSAQPVQLPKISSTLD